MRGGRFGTHQDIIWGPVHAGEYVDGLCGEVSALAGPLAGSGAPAGVGDALAGRVLVEEDEVAADEVEEGAALAWNETERKIEFRDAVVFLNSFCVFEFIDFDILKTPKKHAQKK